MKTQTQTRAGERNVRSFGGTRVVRASCWYAERLGTRTKTGTRDRSNMETVTHRTRDQESGMEQVRRTSTVTHTGTKRGTAT